MKRLLLIITMNICALCINAQTYLAHLQTREAGKGNVTVHQSREIDNLVNGTSPLAVQSKKQTTTTVSAAKVEKKVSVSESRDIVKNHPEHQSEEIDVNNIDTSKKMIRAGYKVTGYRVQIFAGGNSRKDKVRAESISNEIKALFPGQSVYCHFYSPRWICRMGNYRTYEEAQTYLTKVRGLGYSQASIVKGQITVTN